MAVRLLVTFHAASCRGGTRRCHFTANPVGSPAEFLVLFDAIFTLNQVTPELMAALPELRGKDLACWCSPEPCHGAVPLELANS